MNQSSESTEKFRQFLIDRIEQFILLGGELRAKTFGFWQDDLPCCCALTCVYYVSLPEKERREKTHLSFVPRLGEDTAFENLTQFLTGFGFDWTSLEIGYFVSGFDGAEEDESRLLPRELEMYLLGAELRKKYLYGLGQN